MSGVTVSGPLFDGGAAQQIERATDEITTEGGQLVYDLVMARLRAVLKNPTGYYESHVQVSNLSPGVEITDGGVVYGPWLEGTSSRNARTRFKGYQTFRRVLAQAEGRVVDLAEKEIEKMVGRLT